MIPIEEQEKLVARLHAEAEMSWQKLREHDAVTTQLRNVWSVAFERENREKMRLDMMRAMDKEKAS